MDNYQLVERLGQGSFAIVWKARRKSDHRLVACKQLKQAPSTWEECKRLPEIRAAAAVRGPHIIALLEAVRHGSELFLVFEYADSDLYRCLGPCERRRFEEPQVRWVMRQLFSALASVHGAGLVHCDVKPENLLLFARLGPCGETVLKLCDLGQATPAGEVPSYVGTRWYRSPELLLGIGNAGGEIDLWAAGCFMAELILLRPPFPGTDTRDMLFRICSALGAPEAGYLLSERLMQSSGLRFAPCAAEGPLWFELSSTGASSAAVEIVRGLLRYDQGKRLPASRALQSSFFQSGAPEVALNPPDKDIGRHRSAEGLARSRDEAKAVSKKLAAASGSRGMPSGGFPGGSAMGGLGLTGSVFEVTPGAPLGGAGLGAGRGLMGSSQSATSLRPTGSHRLEVEAGYSSGPGFPAMGTSSPSQAVAFGAAAKDDSMLRRSGASASCSGLPTANRRVMQAQAAPAQAAQLRTRRDLTQGAVTGFSAPSRDLRSADGHRPEPWQPWGLSPPANASSNGRSCTLTIDPARPSSPTASSDASPLATREGNIRLDEGSVGSGEEGDDEELAALFWSQVEHSRGGGSDGLPRTDGTGGR